MALKPKHLRTPNRRAFLTGATALLCPVPQLAVASQPAFITVRVGDLECFIVSDGNLLVPTPMLATNMEEPALSSALGYPGARVEPPCNITLVRTPRDVVLIDTGAGPHFMPTAGKFLTNLASTGIKPEDITKVVFTHGHPDHLWGTLDDFDDSPNFPNAEFVMTAAEWNFWSSDDAEARLPDDRKNFARPAAKILAAIKERVRTIVPGEDVAFGLRSVDTPGHTAGHIAIEVGFGANAVLVVADALTHPHISFAHPDWTPAADHHDRDLAVRTRKALLDRLATDQMRLIGFHLPFPGLGRVARSGQAYRYEAEAL